MQKHSFLEFYFFFYFSNFHLQHFGLFSNTFLIHQGAPCSQIRNIHDYSNHFALTVNFHFQSLWPETILSFTRGRHLCNFHSPGGATLLTVIRQGAPIKFQFSAFLKCPHPKAPTLISDPANLTNIPYT